MKDLGDVRTDGVLAGVKVVEFAQNIAVPQCGRLLAGMGADVVKVEPPTGDSMRHLAPLSETEGRAYATANVGKRAITVDLTTPQSREVVDGLLAWADVALVGVKAPDQERFGLDWETTKAVNPRLVHLAFTAFGPEGPEANQGGYDVLVQALSGLGFMMNRSEDGVPRASRPAFIDCASGIMAALGVVAALRHRDATGQGQRVDASLLGTAMALGTPMLTSFEVDQETTAELREEIELMGAAGSTFDEIRTHYDSRVTAAGGAFRLYFRPYATADGLVSVAGMSPALWGKFHDLTGLPKPAGYDNPHSPEFQSIVQRAEELFATRTTEYWLAELRGVGYPCQRYNLPYQAVVDPQNEANGYVVDVDHPDVGAYRTIGMPISFNQAPVGITGPSPGLGAHTVDVMAEIGLTDQQTRSLLAQQVIQGRPVETPAPEPS